MSSCTRGVRVPQVEDHCFSKQERFGIPHCSVSNKLHGAAFFLRSLYIVPQEVDKIFYETPRFMNVFKKARCFIQGLHVNLW
jgi:hypothetical protein